MKWTQLLWRFHEPQGGIPFHHLPHAIGQCEDEFRARQATKGRAKIGHADRGAALCTQRSKLLVRDVLHVWKSCDSKVLRSEVLLQCQAIAKLAPLLLRIENAWHNQAFYFGKELFKFLENFASSQRELKP